MTKKECTPYEFYKIALRYNSSNRKKIIEYSVQCKLIPIKVSTAYAFLNRSVVDIPPKWHRCKGRERLVDVEKVSKVVLNNLDINVAMTTSDLEISDMLKKEMKNYLLDRKGDIVLK